jgi:uncharacterized protein (TIGR03437 family)
MFSGLHPKLVPSCWKAALLATLLPVVLLPAVLFPAVQADTANLAPFYSAASIVNGATQTAEGLAPNTLATMYGTNLAYDTIAVGASDLNGGALPSSLDGVTVYVNNIQAHLFFVSPGQINFLVPYELLPGMATIFVLRQNLAGPVVTIQLNSTAPGLFPWNGNMAIATHLNGTLVSADAPAKAAEIIVIYAGGLGRTTPDTVSGKIVSSAAVIVAAAQMQVLLNTVACPAANVLYAGLAPGFAGLYQINLILPSPLPPNPEIRIAIGAQISPPLIELASQ